MDNIKKFEAIQDTFSLLFEDYKREDLFNDEFVFHNWLSEFRYLIEEASNLRTLCGIEYHSAQFDKTMVEFSKDDISSTMSEIEALEAKLAIK